MKERRKICAGEPGSDFSGTNPGSKRNPRASDSDLKKVYENGINAFVQDCLLNGVETENDFSETYGVLIKEIFSSVRYQVSGVKRRGVRPVR
ncbi:MAG: hypothetical protein ACLR2O_16860 [Coprococcus sp.]